MRRFTFFLAAALIASGSAFAAVNKKHPVHFQGCGPGNNYPCEKPSNGSTPAPAPTGNCAATDTKCTLGSVLAVQTELVAALTEADTTQASIINSATGQSWDPYLHLCLSGTPASGTAGQPGYVAPQAGLIAWIQGLQPPALATVPPLPANPSAATLAEHARLLVLAGEADVNILANVINAGGFPTSVRQACAGFLQDAFVAQPVAIGAQVAVINSLLLKYLPAAMLAKKNQSK